MNNVEIHISYAQRSIILASHCSNLRIFPKSNHSLQTIFSLNNLEKFSGHKITSPLLKLILTLNAVWVHYMYLSYSFHFVLRPNFL
uniref:Uncharacterized protein n=1 Tax=Manihot esculenta TaxID=3983 RepID=A0A2C9VIL2_MANES